MKTGEELIFFILDQNMDENGLRIYIYLYISVLYEVEWRLGGIALGLEQGNWDLRRVKCLRS